MVAEGWGEEVSDAHCWVFWGFMRSNMQVMMESDEFLQKVTGPSASCSSFSNPLYQP